METCQKCNKEFNGEKAKYNCPYCGRGRWFEIGMAFFFSTACICLFLFVAPRIHSGFWRIVVYFFTICGAFFIFPGLGGLFKGLRARNQIIETPSQQLENLTPEGQVAFKEAQKKDTETYLQPYFFICCPNPSLIDALYTLFQARPQPFIKKIGRSSIQPGVLAEQKGAAASLPFGGDFYVLNQSKSMKTMGEVVNSMANQSLGNPLYIAYASIERVGEPWILDVFKTFTEEAMKQGIVPPQMYVADETRDADYLIGMGQPGS